MIQPCVRCQKPLTVPVPGPFARPAYAHGNGVGGSETRRFLGYRCDPWCQRPKPKKRHPKRAEVRP
jgi:hypothetical protein